MNFLLLPPRWWCQGPCVTTGGQERPPSEASKGRRSPPHILRALRPGARVLPGVCRKTHGPAVTLTTQRGTRSRSFWPPDLRGVRQAGAAALSLEAYAHLSCGGRTPILTPLRVPCQTSSFQAQWWKRPTLIANPYLLHALCCTHKTTPSLSQPLLLPSSRWDAHRGSRWPEATRLRGRAGTSVSSPHARPRCSCPLPPRSLFPPPLLRRAFCPPDPPRLLRRRDAGLADFLSTACSSAVVSVTVPRPLGVPRRLPTSPLRLRLACLPARGRAPSLTPQPRALLLALGPRPAPWTEIPRMAPTLCVTLAAIRVPVTSR